MEARILAGCGSSGMSCSQAAALSTAFPYRGRTPGHTARSSHRLTILPGDGIGSVLLQSRSSQEGMDSQLQEKLLSGVAIETRGMPLPGYALGPCKGSDAVRLAALGGYKWDRNEAHLCPEQSLRAAMGAFANLRLASVLPQGCTNMTAGKDMPLGGSSSKQMKSSTSWCLNALLAGFINFPVFLSVTDSAYAEPLNQIYGDLGAGVELGIQALYLAFLLSLVGVASFFVVKQLIIRRELESAARDLQDRVRTGQALPVEYFELGAVMLRKKFYLLASKYLEQAINKWDGDPQDLAQVHNALGYSFVCDNRLDKAIAEYEKAVKIQPGYVVAWNNLGSAYEKKKNLPKALEAYEQALLFDPNNSVAREYRNSLKKRVDRLAGVPIKYE